MSEQTILQRIFAPLIRTAPVQNDQTVRISDGGILSILGFGNQSSAGVNVTPEKALELPAVFAAVDFLSATIATLPLHAYSRGRDGKGRKRVNGQLEDLFNGAANDELTAFDWRKGMIWATLTHGRSVSYIDRNAAGRAQNLIPMPHGTYTVVRQNGRKYYDYNPNGAGKKGQTQRFEAADVIDIPFALETNGLSHISPISKCKDAIGLGLAAADYGARIFRNGGIPPFVLEGPFKTAQAMERASNELAASAASAWKEGKQALALPIGHTVKDLGFDPQKLQMLEVQKWVVEQVARIYSLPPTFLQDLTNGTHSNVEQQDLSFVKHTLSHWIRQIEQEINLKVFGRGRTTNFVEFNLDGLLRGEYKTRVEGHARAIATAQMTPNEARRLEGREDVTGGDELFIQGALMPVKTQKDASIKSSGGDPKKDKGDGGDPDGGDE